MNPRTGQRAALKKIPNVCQSLLACIRTFREIKILCEMHHDNVSQRFISASNTLACLVGRLQWVCCSGCWYSATVVIVVGGVFNDIHDPVRVSCGWFVHNSISVIGMCIHWLIVYPISLSVYTATAGIRHDLPHLPGAVH